MLSLKDIWSQFYSLIPIASEVAVIVGVPYLIGNRRAQRENLYFDFSFSSGIYNAKNDTYSWEIEGIIENRSLHENSIIKIHRIAWKNEKKNAYLADSLAVKVQNSNTNQELKLPIYLKRREALKLRIYTKFVVKGTADESVINEKVEIPGLPGWFLPKYRYEPYFVDILGNYFGSNGELINKKEADLWWTVANTHQSLKNCNPFPYLKHVGFIIISKILFLIKKILRSIGL